ncbi:class E sortase [Streptomyces sp. cmx-18-6]|uniref:class E sortase n=1 Tax=Streptomyces sp. cmx-18-6 TaxID=2790930 RepID=UPI00397ED34F
MTAPRPEDGAGQDGGPYAGGAYGPDGAFVAAVDGLADPLSDPLPGQHASPWFRADGIPGDPAGPDGVAGAAEAAGADRGLQRPQEAPSEWYDPEGYQRDWYGPQGPSAPVPAPVPGPGPRPVTPGTPVTVTTRPVPDETLLLRTTDTRRIVPEPYDAPDPSGPAEQPDPAEPPAGGRAERRRAAKGRGRRPAPAAGATKAAGGATKAAGGAGGAAAPLSRMEARRAAKAAKDSPAVVASRAVGEIFISLGVLMLLFVTYQLWWTNVRAEQIAGKEKNRIQEEWAKGAGKPGTFAPGQGFAIMHIPKLDVVVPIAEGISNEKVLDRGMLGHYGEGKLKTAMPEDKQGNFAVAGHRNTHGEPFRYVNKLSPGDPIVVETRDAYYTYEMTSVLPQTMPSNISVIEPIPVGSGFTKPGRYITLTTCTPEFTSTYRLIVWGKMVDERPRGEGKPKALVG